MNRFLQSVVRAGALACLCITCPLASAQDPSLLPPTISADEIDEMFNALSNWGRWGDDDMRGTLNLVTPEKRRQAAALVREGLSVSLSRNYSTEEGIDNVTPMQIIMQANPGFPVAMDEWRIFYHGLTYTHMDAMCHARYKGRAYNGFPESDANETGCATSGIEHLKDGVLSRGILIDLPRLKGVDYLAPGTPLLPEDILAWERQTGLTLGSGDVVLVRTGRWAKRDAIGPYSLQEGSPGVHVSVLPLLRERDVAVLGTDVGLDVSPSGVDGVIIPTHTVAIASMGLIIIDNGDFQALAETAARLNRWEFMFQLSPIPVVGGTGSIINPIATF